MRKINGVSKIGIVLILISFMFVTGCTSSKEKETDVFQGNLAKGILYNEKIYQLLRIQKMGKKLEK